MVNDRRIAEASAGESDMRNSDAVASTDDCRSQAINKEVHHSSRDGRDSHDDVAVGTSEVAGTLTAYRGTGFRSSGTVTVGLAITRRGPRYLTPRECERLQGMPDDYTLVPFRKNKLAADSPRYKALGNSMAVPVMAWIGRRITRAFAKAGPPQGSMPTGRGTSQEPTLGPSQSSDVVPVAPSVGKPTPCRDGNPWPVGTDPRNKERDAK